MDLPYPLFAKPVAEGTGKGVTPVSKITPRPKLQNPAVTSSNKYKQPVLVETFLPGREFTVGIVGNGAKARAIGLIEVVLLANSEPDVYSYHNKEFVKRWLNIGPPMTRKPGGGAGCPAAAWFRLH